MSDADSFIDEVTDEVRRDRLFALLRRYGWIAIVVIVAVVGGASYNEYRKAQQTAAAEALGDQMLAAMDADAPADRAEALAGISPTSAGGGAVLDFLTAAARAEAGDTEAAVAALEEIARNGDLEPIYRDIAGFKALVLQADTLEASDRRQRFEALARPGGALRLLAEEQLALIDVSEGQTEAALDRLQQILQDAEANTTLRQRVSQVIVALGGTPATVSGVQQG
ncbi:tetratricopeptide repeat protein [Pseudodonghicola flavimaris]|uniref:Tetratricopeptide repeat protein n=1 Tax=Pseudodonghicola flavimaris TaxID=3050036 RepID=A0ABT7F7B8_9RHOB|nr:tetratricopeptide repeat protein [Pseudodonghicola flavimaris]MDK3020515.1 tetratricopeptide repeat protein [Pseudodonghicola flavimaris]